MAEENVANDASASSGPVKLDGLYAFKEAMTTLHSDEGIATPVTVLRFEPWFVTQVKTVSSDGYAAVQISCRPEKKKNGTKAQKGRTAKAGFENGARISKEIRMEKVDGISVGAPVAIDSLQKGDVVKITSRSKGHGFTGVMKRHNFAGGPASHGSKFHRRPGSSGNRTWPGRVMPGKKFPGHWGDETVTVKNVQIVDVRPEDGVVLVKGPVPGSRNSLVRLVKG